MTKEVTNEKIILKKKDVDYLINNIYIKRFEAEDMLVKYKGDISKCLEEYIF